MNLFKNSKKDKNDIYLTEYKNIPIKSDKRVHSALIKYLYKYQNDNIECLDIACGKGAFTQRLVDEFNNFTIDCNDIDKVNLSDGYRNFFNVDLNTDFNFNNKYDLIFAIEIIEHLENPFLFIRQMKKHLKPKGTIFLTTPNVNSYFDRIHYFFTGYPYYFGSRGIINSEGHIMMCPKWLLEHIASKENMIFSIISNNVTTSGLQHLIGYKARLLICLLKPLKYFVNDYNEQSGLICIFQKK